MSDKVLTISRVEFGPRHSVTKVYLSDGSELAGLRAVECSTDVDGAITSVNLEAYLYSEKEVRQTEDKTNE